LVDSAAGRSQTLQTRDRLFTGFSRQRVPWAPDGQSFCLADLWETVGATTSIVSPEAGQVKGWKKTDWGDELVECRRKTRNLTTPRATRWVEDRRSASEA
jgi:hypothetical protein